MQLYDSNGHDSYLEEDDIMICEKQRGDTINISFRRKKRFFHTEVHIRTQHLYDFLVGVSLASGMYLVKSGAFTDGSRIIRFRLTKDEQTSQILKHFLTTDDSQTIPAIGDYIYYNIHTGTIWFTRKGSRLTIANSNRTGDDDKIILDVDTLLYAFNITLGITVPQQINVEAKVSSPKDNAPADCIIGQPFVHLIA